MVVGGDALPREAESTLDAHSAGASGPAGRSSKSRGARRTTGVRWTFIVDVSRSVPDTIDRDFLLRFLRTVFDEWRRARIVLFDTSVREVTAQFAAPSADAAVRALQQAETKWGGGTRIGNAIQSVRRDDPRAVDRKTTAFVVSDGLEVGETGELEQGMAWLARRSDTVLWLLPVRGRV